MSDRTPWLALRPRRLPDEEVVLLSGSDSDGLDLRASAGSKTVHLSADEAVVWRLIDGKRSIQDIASSYFLTVGAFRFQAVTESLTKLHAGGLLDRDCDGLSRLIGSAGASPPAQTSIWKLEGTDPWIRRLFGRVRPIAVWTAPVWLAVTVYGLWTYAARLRGEFASTFGFGTELVLVLLGILTVHVLIHESGHAVACIALGRRVRRIGLYWRGRLPTPYVATTNMYGVVNRKQVVIALAGPAANLITCAVLIAIARHTPWETARSVLIALADGALFVGVVNLWPFWGFGDGYNILAVVSRSPLLARESLQFLRGNGWQQITPFHATFLAGVIATITMAMAALALLVL